MTPLPAPTVETVPVIAASDGLDREAYLVTVAASDLDGTCDLCDRQINGRLVVEFDDSARACLTCVDRMQDSGELAPVI